MFPACLFVFMACLFVIRLVCSGFRACRRSSTTGRAKKVPDPTAYQDGHYDLSVTLPSCWGFHNRLIIFAPFFYDPTTFATDPSVIGSVPVETLHKMLQIKNKHMLYLILGA